MKATAAVTLVSALMALTATTGDIHADEADQARRLTHFEWLRDRDIFQSMEVIDGVPRLVLAGGRDQTDQESLEAFCRIVFDYYAEADPAYTQMLVIDGVTGEQVGIVDADGYHSGS